MIISLKSCARAFNGLDVTFDRHSFNLLSFLPLSVPSIRSGAMPACACVRIGGVGVDDVRVSS